MTVKRAPRRVSESERDDLGVYHSKRDFTVTDEPKGELRQKAVKGVGPKNGKAFTYVIQRHDATRLHFDFRLELDGVLKSWAVPKGPSLSPGEKRLAVEVEDHPYDYGSFEGAIPKGEYGGGHVLVWDKGEWTPVGDPHEGLKKGHLKFTLEGDRLHGGFALIRMHPRGKDKDNGKNNWLLIKEQDQAAKKGAAAEVAEAAAPPSAKKIELQLATLQSEIPLHDAWIYEMKLDGYRALTRLDDGNAHVYSRSGLDWSHRFPAICKAIEALPIKNAIFDGEICAIDEKGRTRFQELQNALSAKDDSALRYFVFDLLFVDGFDIRDRPLLVRKAILESILHDREAPLTFVTHLDSEKEIKKLFAHVCEQGLEGIIAKRRERPYVGGRGGDWVKVKCTHQQEMIIVGFTAPSGSRGGLGALLLGVQDQGEIRYVGKVGTGFSQKA
ncbi:MAG: non-homologous end-joining DNA ligase, partial [Polyangiaceae bacterium]